MRDDQIRMVADYGVFDVVSRTLRVGSDICGSFQHDSTSLFPGDPAVATNGICYYGGQVDPNKGDCAAVSPDAGDRRFCPCSQFGKGHGMIAEHSIAIGVLVD